LTFLEIDYPTWNITLIKNNKSQIETAIFDTTASFQKYLNQSDTKGKEFFNWLKPKYPNETSDSLYTISGLLQKRLKEYVNK